MIHERNRKNFTTKLRKPARTAAFPVFSPRHRPCSYPKTLESEIRAPAVVGSHEVLRKDADVQLVDPLAVDGAQHGAVEPHLAVAAAKELEKNLGQK